MKFILAAALTLAASSARAETPDSLYQEMLPTLVKHQEITEIELCVEDDCKTFRPVWERKGGSSELLYQAPKGSDEGVAGAVGEIVGTVGKKVGAGGRVVVDYHKKPDGEIKVHVEASFGVGSAAEAAAGGGVKDDK
jgi:hypothetical protein